MVMTISHNDKKYNSFSLGTWWCTAVADSPGGRGWTGRPRGPSSIFPSSEGPTPAPIRPDLKTSPPGEVDRQDRAFCFLAGQRKRGSLALEYSSVPSLSWREVTKRSCHCTTSRWMTGNIGENDVLKWLETGISLAGETLSFISPIPKLALRVQVAQRIQGESQHTSAVWIAWSTCFVSRGETGA